MLRATDSDQFAAYRAKRIPAMSTVRPGIWNLHMPFDEGSVPYSMCYIIEDSRGGLHVIDPGFDSPENRVVFAGSIRSLGFRLQDVVTITATHLHRDHMGLADWMISRSGAEFAIHRADASDLQSSTAEQPYSSDLESLRARWGIPSDQLPRLAMQITSRTPPTVPSTIRSLEDGDLLPIPGRNAHVIHSPGHTNGHVCVAIPDESLLLVGDHVFPRASPGIGRGGYSDDVDQVADILDSLERLTAFDDFEVGPGHAYRFHGLGERRVQIRDHVLTRARGARGALERSPEATVWQVASALTWQGGSMGDLEGAKLQSALLQTECYIRYVNNAAANSMGGR